MYAGFSLLAIIPARGGSKGLPNKNIAICAGKPLIHWTIEAANENILIDRTIISTDSELIAKISNQAGGESHIRPNKLAEDNSSLIDVINNAWGACLTQDGKRYDYVIVLQPTSPLRGPYHIEAAVKEYFSRSKTEFDTLVSVSKVGKKYRWLMEINNCSGYIDFCMNISTKNPQRQELDGLYLPNGAIYIIKGSAISNGFYSGKTIPYIMKEYESVDIDTIEELHLASSRINYILKIKK